MSKIEERKQEILKWYCDDCEIQGNGCGLAIVANCDKGRVLKLALDSLISEVADSAPDNGQFDIQIDRVGDTPVKVTIHEFITLTNWKKQFRKDGGK
jgi:hypothetical protein